jgi:hypothetical protein
MYKKITRNISTLIILMICACSGYCQKLSLPQFKQLIVETVHTYQSSSYEDTIVFTGGMSAPKLDKQGPEYALVEFINFMASGDADGAKSKWTIDSIKLISKRNNQIPKSDLIKSMRVQNEGVNFQFVNKIVYGNYVIIELKLSKNEQAKPIPNETYALVSENSIWKLTQELADDPVMCCSNSSQSRLRKVGVPGGEFKQVLKALNQ